MKKIDIAAIRQSVQLLMTSGIEYEFRTTLMEEMHTRDDILQIADWLEGAKRYYLQKYKDNEGCISHGFNPVAESVAKQYLVLFEGRVEQTGLRGY